MQVSKDGLSGQLRVDRKNEKQSRVPNAETSTEPHVFFLS